MRGHGHRPLAVADQEQTQALLVLDFARRARNPLQALDLWSTCPNGSATASLPPEVLNQGPSTSPAFSLSVVREESLHREVSLSSFFTQPLL